MVRLGKSELLATVEQAILDGGWRYLCLGPSGDHPARYSVFLGEQRHDVCVYIWNLTPGGRNRPLDEWRIQATGVGRFLADANSETLILGWEDERGVFVGFDRRKHDGQLGHSPSIQLVERTLDDAVRTGFAIHNKGNDETGGRLSPGLPADVHRQRSTPPRLWEGRARGGALGPGWRTSGRLGRWRGRRGSATPPLRSRRRPTRPAGDRLSQSRAARLRRQLCHVWRAAALAGRRAHSPGSPSRQHGWHRQWRRAMCAAPSCVRQNAGYVRRRVSHPCERDCGCNTRSEAPRWRVGPFSRCVAADAGAAAGRPRSPSPPLRRQSQRTAWVVVLHGLAGLLPF